MEGLKKGHIVHHVIQPEGMVGTLEYAAIISRVHKPHEPSAYPVSNMEAYADAHKDGEVDLFSFMENYAISYKNIPYSAEKLPNTWHFMEEQ